jgi:hypothetical protein
MTSEPVSTTAVVGDLPHLQELLGITRDMVSTLRRRAKPEVPERLVLAFATKAMQTAQAIVLLYQGGLSLEAQSLVRVLFEVSVSFDAFLRLLRDAPKAACQRVLDAMMLEKIKQQRASNFAGRELVAAAPGPEELDSTERDIASRYSDSELKSLRKNGFSGISVEDRARQAGAEEYYDIVYRNFSRNVHGSDFSELMLANDPAMLADRRADLFEARDGVALDAAFIALFLVSDQVNRGFGLGQDERLAGVARARKQKSQDQR